MLYVESYILPVVESRLAEYRQIAEDSAVIWLELGALSVMEATAHDTPFGKTTSFPRAVVLQEGEITRLGATAAVVSALVKNGLIREEARHVERVAYADNWTGGEIVTGLPPKLNDEQAGELRRLKPGTRARNVYLWSLAVDPVVLSEQARAEPDERKRQKR